MDNLLLIAVFTVAVVAWLATWLLVERAYKKKKAKEIERRLGFAVAAANLAAEKRKARERHEKKSFEEDQRRIRANIAISKLAHRKKGEN